MAVLSFILQLVLLDFLCKKTQHLWCHGDPYFNFIHALGTIGPVGGMHKTPGSKSTVFIYFSFDEVHSELFKLKD